MKVKQLLLSMMTLVLMLALSLTLYACDGTTAQDKLTLDNLQATTDKATIQSNISSVFGIDITLPDGSLNGEVATIEGIKVYKVTVSASEQTAINYFQSLAIALEADGWEVVDDSLQKSVGNITTSIFIDADSSSVASFVIYIFTNSEVTSSEQSGTSGNSVGEQKYTIVLPQSDEYQIVITEGATDNKVQKGGSFAFVINMNAGYDGSNLDVKANGNTVPFVDGAFRVTNVTDTQVITVRNVQQFPEINLTTRMTSCEYNGTAQAPVISTTTSGAKLYYATDKENPTWSENKPSYTDAGDYNYYVKATCDGYRDTYINNGDGFVFYIRKATIAHDSIILGNSSAEFDNQNHTFSVSGMPSGTTAQYSINDGEFSTDIPTFKNAGCYKIDIKVGGKNYIDYTQMTTFDISYGDVEGITSTSFYGKINQTSGSISVEGTQVGDVVEYSLQQNGEWSQTNPVCTSTGTDGTTVYYRVTRNTNYRYSGFAFVKLVPMDKEFTGITVSSYERKYDGNEKRVSLFGVSLGDTVYYRKSATDEWSETVYSETNVGEYPYQFMVARPGEGLCTGSGTLKINKGDYDQVTDVQVGINDYSNVVCFVDVELYPTLASLPALPNGYTWDEPTTAIKLGPGNKYYYTYNADPDNYNDYTGESLSIWGLKYYDVTFVKDGCTETLAENQKLRVQEGSSVNFSVALNADKIAANCEILVTYAEGTNTGVVVADMDGNYRVSSIYNDVTINLYACYSVNYSGLWTGVADVELNKDCTDILASKSSKAWIKIGGKFSAKLTTGNSIVVTASRDSEATWETIAKNTAAYYEVENITSNVIIKSTLS